MQYQKCKLILIAVLGIILCILLVYLLVFGRAFRQPENHIGIIMALPKVILSSEAVQIDTKTYLAKDINSFIKAMNKQGFTYIDQLGSGHFFQKDGISYISISRMYSSHFMVFTCPIAN